MIEFHFETDFKLTNAGLFSDWIYRVIVSEGYTAGALSYIFCSDAYLSDLNMEYLGHDTLTDIITFDYTQGKLLSGDIFISIERVLENARHYNEAFIEELKRVMAHGVLHLAGYKDKTKSEMELMRSKENEKTMMFHVEQC